MKSLNEIKNLVQEDISSDLELAIFCFLNSSTKLPNISNEEIIEGLDFYGEQLKDFWPKVFSFNNIDLFLNQPFLKQELLSWIFDQSEFDVIKGKVNLKTLVFSSDAKIGNIFSKITPKVLDEEVSKLIKNLSDLDESLDKEVDVLLVKNKGHFDLILNDPQENSKSNLKKCLEMVSMTIVVSVIFSSSIAKADDTQKAISHATKMTMEQTELGKRITEVQKSVEKEGRRIIKEYSGEVPAAIVGTGAKIAIEKKVDFKGKSKIIPVNYEVSVGLDESKVKIGNDDLFDAKVEGWISGSAGKGHNTNKLEIGLRYDF